MPNDKANRKSDPKELKQTSDTRLTSERALADSVDRPDPAGTDDRSRGDRASAGQTGTGAPASVVQDALDDPPSPDTTRQLEDVFGRPPRKHGQSEQVEFDYDDVVQQSFPASDSPPPPQ